MTEFTQLNRKIPNRTTSRTGTIPITPTTLSSSSSKTIKSTTMQPPPATPTMSSRDNDFKEANKMNIYPRLEEHDDIIATIATIQTQSTITATSSSIAATMDIRTSTSSRTTTSETLPVIITTTFTPQQIQMTKKQIVYDTAPTTSPAAATSTELGRNKGSKRQKHEGVLYLHDNRIPEQHQHEQDDNVAAIEMAANAVTLTIDNYVAADKNVVMQPTIVKTALTKPLEIAKQQQKQYQQQLQIANAETTSTTKTIQITRQDYSSNSNMSSRRHNRKSIENWNRISSSRIELSTNKHKQHNTSDSSSSKSSRSISSKVISKNNQPPSNNSSSNNSIVDTAINNSGSNLRLINMKMQKSKDSTELAISADLNNNQNPSATTAISSVNITPSITSSCRSPCSNTLNITSNKYNNNNSNTNIINNTSITSNNKNHKISPSSRSSSSNSTSSSTDNSNKINHPPSLISLQIPKTTPSSLTTSLHIGTTSPTYAPILHHYNQLLRPALLHRNIRQTIDDEQNDKCRMFVEGDPEKNELYSPDYPNDYPKNINCTRIITAPKGQIIRLDFRNSFHIEEKEECKFDFLEIRDGQYGFSNLIGKYCGTDFPPEITSKERYLWLHFHSDESIEYSGFTAVYEFIDRNRDAPSTDLNCTIEKNGYEGFVNASDVPAEIRDTVIRNKIPLDCMWRIQVQDKWKIQVKFMDFKLAKPNDCETNFLDIFPEQTVMPLRVKNFCGSAGEGITSDSNILHMRFYAEQIAINSSFSILFTAFRDRGTGCVDLEYDCEDNTCIGPNLTCNGHDNCKFRWDEEGCKTKEEGQSEHMKIIISVFCVILGGMVLTFLVNCVRKIMHDQKIIREHIRQSRESKLDEMGRNSKARSRDNMSIVSPRQKHSQTSLQILDDVSNRYYREMELQTKGNFKEKDPSILRHHDMIVQTSLCSTDDSSTTTAEQQLQTPTSGVGGNACDMGCQTRESLFATASLMRQKSKTPSMAGSQRTIEGVPPPPRFSTFGYDAAQIAPPPPPTVSTLSRRNMHLPQESFEMEQLPQQQQTTHMMMPHQQQQQLQQHAQQQHQHLHHRPSQEICHHHHQHQQHLQQQQQKQTLPRHHQQQQQHHHPHLQQQQHHHIAAATIPPNVTQLPSAPGTTVVTAISTGTSGRQREQGGGGGGGGNIQQGGKNKQTKVDESKVFIDIRNSAPDVIIMTSH